MQATFLENYGGVSGTNPDGSSRAQLLQDPVAVAMQDAGTVFSRQLAKVMQESVQRLVFATMVTCQLVWCANQHLGPDKARERWQPVGRHPAKIARLEWGEQAGFVELKRRKGSRRVIAARPGKYEPALCVAKPAPAGFSPWNAALGSAAIGAFLLGSALRRAL